MMIKDEKQGAFQNEEEYMKTAMDCFYALAGKVNGCFVFINLLEMGGQNRAVAKDTEKIKQLTAKGKRWRKTFYSIYIHYKRLCSLMNTLIVADEEEFENLKSVCGHFGIPERIFMRELVNSDVSSMLPEIEKIDWILKKIT